MIAVILQRDESCPPIASWTVQDWVGDPAALQALADAQNCVIIVVPLAKVQPLDPKDLVDRARRRLADVDEPWLSHIVTYRPRPPGRDWEDEDLPL